jgi:hypothetical protein
MLGMAEIVPPLPEGEDGIGTNMVGLDGVLTKTPHPGAFTPAVT